MCLSASYHLLYPYLTTLPTQVKVKGWKGERVFLEEGWRNKDESLYVFLSPATYFYLLCPTLPTLSKSEKVKRWKSEKMQPPQYEITMQER